MKKVLFVSFVDLFPVNAGNRRRIVDMIETLKNNGCDVYYLHYNSKNTNYYKKKTMEFFGKDRYFCYEKQTYGHRLRKKLRNKSDRDIYYHVDEMIPKGLFQFAEELNKRISFDVVIAEYVMSSKILNAFGDNTLKIIDTHDIFTERNRMFTSIGKKPLWFFLRNSQEKKGLNRADVVLAIQSEEARLFRKWVNRSVKVVMIGNAIKIKKPQKNNSRKILFVGSSNILNQIGIRWFIDEVIPLLSEADVEILIAGSVCNGIPDSESYVKLGFVENLERLYDEAQVVINPVQNGTGLNIKTVEALGYSKPLVSTPAGVRGLPNATRYVKVADSPLQFGTYILELLNSQDECERFSKYSYNFAKKYEKRCNEKLLDVLEISLK